MIRRYQTEDLDQLLDVWHDSARLAYPFWTARDFAEERKAIAEQHLPVSETHVFEREGRVVGFIAMMGNEVGGIFVAPDCHGQGVGRALMDHVRASRDYLVLDVFEENAVGRRFYDAYGFNLEERRTDRETGRVVLRLRLPSREEP